MMNQEFRAQEGISSVAYIQDLLSKEISSVAFLRDLLQRARERGAQSYEFLCICAQFRHCLLLGISLLN